MADEIELLTATDVSKILKCSLSLVYVMAERQQLPCVRWAAGKSKKMLRFRRGDLIEFIQNAYQKGGMN